MCGASALPASAINRECKNLRRLDISSIRKLYRICMADIEILDLEWHSTPEGVPFVVAIVDDTFDGEVKLVVLFSEEGSCAVLSLDKLHEEDISSRVHYQASAHLEGQLRRAIGEKE